MSQNLSSAAVVTGALRVNKGHAAFVHYFLFCSRHCFGHIFDFSDEIKENKFDYVLFTIRMSPYYARPYPRDL